MPKARKPMPNFPTLNDKQMERAKEARNRYFRDWRRKHPERVKAAQDRYWLKKAQQQETQPDEQQRAAGDNSIEGSEHG